MAAIERTKLVHALVPMPSGAVPAPEGAPAKPAQRCMPLGRHRQGAST
jgi:hypothetical protein